MPGGIDGLVEDMLIYIGPEMPFVQRMAMANLWLFGPVVESMFEAAPATNALLRTTTAPTIIQAGNKANVLPQVARATINFRLAPGDSIQDVVDHVREVIADERIALEVVSGTEASPVSDPASPWFGVIQRSIRQLIPEAIVAPGIMVGGTDAKHYQGLSKNVYRFAPIWLKPEDLDRLHGLNERISTKNYTLAIQFYTQVIRNLNEIEE